MLKNNNQPRWPANEGITEARKLTDENAHLNEEFVRLGIKFKLEDIEKKKKIETEKKRKEDEAMARIHAREKKKVGKMQLAFKDFFHQQLLESEKKKILEKRKNRKNKNPMF